MIRFGALCMMCFVLAAATAGQATAQGADSSVDQKINEEFTVELTDGSSLICKPALSAIPFKTDYADLTIPFQRIETLAVDHKTGSVTVVFLNADKLQGQCPLTEITVTWLLGELALPMVRIATVTTTLKRAPVFHDSPAARNSCINNLRIIDAAKEQWALASGSTRGDVDLQGANEYIKGNRTPTCPAGGTYSYNVLGSDPECNVPGHSLSH